MTTFGWVIMLAIAGVALLPLAFALGAPLPWLLEALACRRA